MTLVPARRGGASRRAVLVVPLLALALGGCSTAPGPGAGPFAWLGIGPAPEPRPVPVFVASTRAEPGRAGGQAALYRRTVTVPPGHRPGLIERPQIGPESAQRHFTMGPRRAYDPEGFKTEIASHLAGQVVRGRDVLLFVHGYNTGYEESVFRVVQIAVDAGFAGVPAVFTWPSRNQLLAYGTDREIATASRDALEKLLLQLAEVPGVGRIHILAHSMGTWMTMEALRQVAIGGRPTLDGRLGEVMLAAPDLDVEVFRGQLARIGRQARISLLIASDDRALQVSTQLAGRTRLGVLDLKNAQHRAEVERLGVRVYDLTGAGGNDAFRHGTFAEAPEVVRLIGSHLGEAKVQDLSDEFNEPAPADVPASTQPFTPPAVSFGAP